MEKTFFEMQKELGDVSLKAYGWIDSRVFRDEFNEVLPILKIARERLHWAIGGISLANFLNGRSIFPDGAGKADVWSAHGPFWALDGDGANQTWAWEAFRMRSLSGALPKPCDPSIAVPLIVLLAKKDVVHKGIERDYYPSDSDIRCMSQAYVSILRVDRLGEFVFSRDEFEEEMFGLTRSHLLCGWGDRLFASAINGFGTPPCSYSLFSAACLARRALDIVQVECGLAGDDELSLLIRKMEMTTSFFADSLSADPLGLGKELLGKILDMGVLPSPGGGLAG